MVGLSRWLAGALLLWVVPGLADTSHLYLAQIQGAQLTAHTLDVEGRLQTLAPAQLPKPPLGSLWKLFVYAYLQDQRWTEAPYACTGQSPDEVYCCNPGEQIDRAQALVRSCGLYFEPQRLGIDATAWATFWADHAAPGWLQDLSRMQPDTTVAVIELLQALQTLPARGEAQRHLLSVVLENAQGRLAARLGGRWRIKTWSWHGAQDRAQRVGGFAGWLTDGTVLWAQGVGTSQTVLDRFADALDEHLPLVVPTATPEATDCVEVRLFARYPIQAVYSAQGKTAPFGALQGAWQVQFVNGNRIDVEGQGDVYLLETDGAPQLVLRTGREDYVARVLDREAGSEPREAARALAILARTYVLQNAVRVQDCLQIEDSSARQRVAPRPPSSRARQITAWTADTVLAGMPVRYHRDQGEPGQLNWLEAQQQARTGLNHVEILAHAFPQASLSRWDQPQARCAVLDDARHWLLQRLAAWRPLLNPLPGYQETQRFAVCRLQVGRPHADRIQRRLYVRGVLTLQDRLDLTHEYLHLAFDGHPLADDETFIESTTRRLLLEGSPP